MDDGGQNYKMPGFGTPEFMNYGLAKDPLANGMHHQLDGTDWKSFQNGMDAASLGAGAGKGGYSRSELNDKLRHKLLNRQTMGDSYPVSSSSASMEQLAMQSSANYFSTAGSGAGHSFGSPLSSLGAAYGHHHDNYLSPFGQTSQYAHATYPKSQQLPPDYPFNSYGAQFPFGAASLYPTPRMDEGLFGGASQYHHHQHHHHQAASSSYYGHSPVTAGPAVRATSGMGLLTPTSTPMPHYTSARLTTRAVSSLHASPGAYSFPGSSTATSTSSAASGGSAFAHPYSQFKAPQVCSPRLVPSSESATGPKSAIAAPPMSEFGDTTAAPWPAASTARSSPFTIKREQGSPAPMTGTTRSSPQAPSTPDGKLSSAVQPQDTKLSPFEAEFQTYLTKRHTVAPNGEKSISAATASSVQSEASSPPTTTIKLEPDCGNSWPPKSTPPASGPEKCSPAQSPQPMYGHDSSPVKCPPRPPSASQLSSRVVPMPAKGQPMIEEYGSANLTATIDSVARMVYDDPSVTPSPPAPIIHRTRPRPTCSPPPPPPPPFVTGPPPSSSTSSAPFRVPSPSSSSRTVASPFMAATSSQPPFAGTGSAPCGASQLQFGQQPFATGPVGTNLNSFTMGAGSAPAVNPPLPPPLPPPPAPPPVAGSQMPFSAGSIKREETQSDEIEQLYRLERLQKNAKMEVPTCTCQTNDEASPDRAPYYTQLGTAPNIEGIREIMETRTSTKGDAIRIEKLLYTGKEGKTSQGCPIAKWVLRRTGPQEKFLVLTRHREGHRCPTAWIVVVLVAWEAVPAQQADSLYSTLVYKLNKFGKATDRRCATNELRNCACQGMDPETCGESYSFGCSWSMYYDGCKYARSMSPRKFKLLEESEERDVEEKLQALATHLAPFYQRVCPESYHNQVEFEDQGLECRLGTKPGRPWSGVTACVDFCAHSHKDVHNMNNGCTVVTTLTRHRDLQKPDDEQLHVLPLYIIDSTDENGSKEGQEAKLKNGSLEALTKYPMNLRLRNKPLESCRKRSKKRQALAPKRLKNATPELAFGGMGGGLGLNPYEGMYGRPPCSAGFDLVSSCKRALFPNANGGDPGRGGAFGQLPHHAHHHGDIKPDLRFLQEQMRRDDRLGVGSVPDYSSNFGGLVAPNFLDRGPPPFGVGCSTASNTGALAHFGNYPSYSDPYASAAKSSYHRDDSVTTAKCHQTVEGGGSSADFSSLHLLSEAIAIKSEPFDDYMGLSGDIFAGAAATTSDTKNSTYPAPRQSQQVASWYPPASPGHGVAPLPSAGATPGRASVGGHFVGAGGVVNNNGRLPTGPGGVSCSLPGGAPGDEWAPRPPMASSDGLCKTVTPPINGGNTTASLLSSYKPSGSYLHHGHHPSSSLHSSNAATNFGQVTAGYGSPASGYGQTGNMLHYPGNQPFLSSSGQRPNTAYGSANPAFFQGGGGGGGSARLSDFVSDVIHQMNSPVIKSEPHADGGGQYNGGSRVGGVAPGVHDPDDPDGVYEVYCENEENFLDNNIGGVAIALAHGSVLFECAKHELHATTALRRPDRRQPSRISLVFYQHKSMNRRFHGHREYQEKMERKERDDAARARHESALLMGASGANSGAEHDYSSANGKPKRTYKKRASSASSQAEGAGSFDAPPPLPHLPLPHLAGAGINECPPELPPLYPPLALSPMSSWMPMFPCGPLVLTGGPY